jgi:hypothetical protein
MTLRQLDRVCNRVVKRKINGFINWKQHLRNREYGVSKWRAE